MKKPLLSLLLAISTVCAYAQTHVTVSGIVVDTTKVFDANDTALVTNQGILATIAATDTVSVLTEAHYANVHAGSGIQIRITSTLTGPQASSYILDNPNDSITGTITKRQLYRDSVVVDSIKFYDGTVNCTVQYPGTPRNWVTHHVLTTIDTCEFLDPNVGRNKPVRIIFGAYGEDEDDYIAPPDTMVYATIKPRALLTKNVKIQRTKTYDRTTDVTITSRGWFTNVLEEDTIYFNLTAYYEDKNVGTNKKIYTHYDIYGPDTMNYSAPNDDEIWGCEIQAIQLHAQGGSAEKTKTYDGETTAVVTTPSQPVGVLDGDEVYLNTMANFDDEHIGNNHDIIFSYTIYGNDAMNYLAPEDSIFCHDGEIFPVYSSVETIADNILISPNPCHGMLQVSTTTGNHTIIIYNVSGIELYRTTFSGAETTLNLTSLPAGIYLLNLDNRTTKLLIEPR